MQRLAVNYNLCRGFFTGSALAKSACSIVKPVHHLVKIDKAKLSPRFPELNFNKNDIRSPAFKPVAVCQDRGQEHYLNTLQSDLLLMTYSHGKKKIEGLKRRPWDGTSPYHLNRRTKNPKGSKSQLPDVNPIDWKNIPNIESVVLNCYVSQAKENPLLAISASLQLQQITGVKPIPLYSRTDVPSWKVRKGNHMGAKVELKGRPMTQFLLTLSEIVLPRIREYKGISNTSGNKFGSISFGLTPSDVRFFPEIDSNQDLWPVSFGMHININTSAQTDAQARTLISGFQIPFNGSKNQEF
ncbi:hypothetical protein TPHA_0C01920 [Tetrapisispora phaffii CBS 4417]|uniref:Large ribosomal subunit protein uL5m n=1 Tax=Tetrapisispora phaffii (strain ATCC 24235 / CBS 4417 / NBRC 1672 / NRRL Y-8282 / UCD 70-5) TaxID=1071381 RepID=G8BRH1_TETPH|nr:mitochondrial 54S ribosomal protein YmL7/YmL5 TPHA_0C01920 [Tetrapisispora phaffii CBS 4417]CCE62347.1 hypothetical protein TPHA_0C01920 [Tetrapisispora phaffii CBS 4417]